MSRNSPTDYAELYCISNFSFLRGASHPEELVGQAAELGYRALALTDECSLAGAVRAFLAGAQDALAEDSEALRPAQGREGGANGP